MMLIFARLDGGASYSNDNPTAVLYDTLNEVMSDWADRASMQHTRHLDRTDGRYYFCPCWGDPRAGGETNDGRYHAGFVYYAANGDPDLAINEHGYLTLDTTDRYPDRELTVGPHGGLRWEHT